MVLKSLTGAVCTFKRNSRRTKKAAPSDKKSTPRAEILSLSSALITKNIKALKRSAAAAPERYAAGLYAMRLIARYTPKMPMMPKSIAKK